MRVSRALREPPLNVLVTRPTAQSANFVNLLLQAGHVAHEMPCISIEPIESSCLKVIGQPDAIIFTSVNAVEMAHKSKPLPWNTGDSAILAIGTATANALANRKMNTTETPLEPYNSESLLCSKTLNSKNLQNVAIIKGLGGRSLLQNRLRERGYTVALYDVYQRRLPNVNSHTLKTVFLNSPVDIVTITSNEMLQNLVHLAGHKYQDMLLSLPLVVNSQRAADLAKDLGFRNHVVVASSPGDQGLLDAINIWIRS